MPTAAWGPLPWGRHPRGAQKLHEAGLGQKAGLQPAALAQRCEHEGCVLPPLSPLKDRGPRHPHVAGRLLGAESNVSKQHAQQELPALFVSKSNAGISPLQTGLHLERVSPVPSKSRRTHTGLAAVRKRTEHEVLNRSVCGTAAHKPRPCPWSGPAPSACSAPPPLLGPISSPRSTTPL